MRTVCVILNVVVNGKQFAIEFNFFFYLPSETKRFDDLAQSVLQSWIVDVSSWLKPGSSKIPLVLLEPKIKNLY